MADDILKNIPLPADLPENWTSEQTVAPTGEEVGMDEQHGYNYLMKQVNNAQKAAKALNDGKLGLHDSADNGVVASGPDYVRFGNGTQICSGGVSIDGNYYLVTFPVPFVSLNSVTVSSNADIGTGVLLSVGYETVSSFRIYTNSPDNTAKGRCTYIAVGHWK